MSRSDKAVRATQFKNNLGQYLGDVIHRSLTVVVEKHGEAVAVLVGMKRWKELTGEKVPERSAWVEACRRLSRKIHKEGRKKQTPAVTLIRELRQQS